jgi:hypothetical protein
MASDVNRKSVKSVYAPATSNSVLPAELPPGPGYMCFFQSSFSLVQLASIATAQERQCNFRYFIIEFHVYKIYSRLQ